MVLWTHIEYWRLEQGLLSALDVLFFSAVNRPALNFFNTNALLLTSFEEKFIFLCPRKPQLQHLRLLLFIIVTVGCSIIAKSPRFK